MLRRILAGALATLLLLLAGCSFGAPATTGTVTGHVYGVPGCSADVGHRCPPLLMGSVLITFKAGDGAVRTTRTGFTGGYSIDLPAGAWSVEVEQAAKLLKGPGTINVNAGQKQTVDFTIDSRIR